MEEKLAAGIDALPMLPTVLVKLFSTTPDQDDYFENIVGLSEGDPGLSLKIIKSSNSAASAPVVKIETLPAAVLRLGAKRTVSLITSLMMAKVFNPKDGAEMNIWIHSLQVAAGARMIIALSKDRDLDPEVGYLAGQLHDIGRLVLHAVDPDHFNVINEADYQNGNDLLQAEMDIYDGLTHAELGLQVCEHWKLPAIIADTVRDHHLAFNSDMELTAANKYIAAVSLADQISLQLLEEGKHQGMEQEQIAGMLNNDSLAGYRNMINIDEQQLVDLVEAIDDDARRIASVAGLTY